MGRKLLPKSIAAKLVGLVYRCETCGTKTEKQFDDSDRPEPGESCAVSCPACGAVHFHTSLSGPIRELEAALNKEQR